MSHDGRHLNQQIKSRCRELAPRYEAALSGLAYVWAGYEKTSAWRIGYRDGRAMRLKQHAEAKHLDGWPVGRTLSVPETSAASPALLAVTHRPVPVASVKP